MSNATHSKGYSPVPCRSNQSNQLRREHNSHWIESAYRWGKRCHLVFHLVHIFVSWVARESTKGIAARTKNLVSWLTWELFTHLSKWEITLMSPRRARQEKDVIRAELVFLYSELKVTSITIRSCSTFHRQAWERMIDSSNKAGCRQFRWRLQGRLQEHHPADLKGG